MHWYTSTCLECPVRSTETTDGEPIREDLVRRVRAEIAAGTYDTPERFECALDRLFDWIEEN